MEKYLYLTRPEWAHAWIHGGTIPLKPASTYKSADRKGIFTPDENKVYDLPLSEENMRLQGYGFENCRDITMIECTGSLSPIPDFKNRSTYTEDGLIICFSNRFDPAIAVRLGKNACVRILDVGHLKSVLDRELGVTGKMGPCQYTNDHQRNHFLKSEQDAWQDEFRIFWNILEDKEVTLPAGIGILQPLN